ncbi:MAG: exonuclease, partial [Proteobacteria bacterium]|nr:exonuclease [Pseudomonadota bacterium]
MRPPDVPHGSSNASCGAAGDCARPHSSPLPQAGEPASSQASIESLRRLLGVRERKRVPLSPCGPVDRTLPGEEIAPGLRLIET